MDVSERTLAALGFDEVKTALGSRCRTELGKARALGRVFFETQAEVLASLAVVEEARALRQEPLSLPLAGLVDLRAALERASKGAMLEPRELIAICQALFAYERTADILHERRERFSALAVIGRRLPLLQRLATRLDRSFESSGEISDRASDDLRAARERARGLHRRIRSRLDDLLRNEKFTVNLRENYYSIRNDRYVVPVLSSHQREVDGIVHNASGTGQTLFVEPQELIGIGNELAIAQSLVLEEEHKVLMELSQLVAKEALKIEEGLEAAAELDELEAIAALATELHATAPVVEPANGPLNIKGLRHPRLVLKGDQVVANDVDLSSGARVLVVSGPNAGGKTVTLTGVGLCALMVRAGLPIPVDPGSSIPLFNQVHSAIGDLQDIEQGLSTFSAHVTVLKGVVSTAKHGALVLIDEIAADTDPREGAAIATAVLEALLEKGALMLVTTHLEELKALAHLDPRFVNGRVGFDAKRMAPTYRLQLGASGASSAIDIARRVGLPDEICQRATALAENAGGALSKALAAAEEERRKMLDQRDQSARDAKDAQRLKSEAELELAQLHRRRKEEELKFREALRAELEFARTQIRSLVQKLETDRSDKTIRAAQDAASELTTRINEQTVAERTLRQALQTRGEELAPLELRPGAKARHRSLDAEVEIIDVSEDEVVVTMGALKMRVPASELLPPRKSTPSPSGKSPPFGGVATARRDEATTSGGATRPLTLASPTLDVRGQRAEEALRDVERFLDRLSQQGEASAVLLHGHGTGALKATIRSYLQQSPYAKSFRSGDGSEGGDGVTVVLLE